MNLPSGRRAGEFRRIQCALLALLLIFPSAGLRAEGPAPTTPNETPAPQQENSSPSQQATNFVSGAQTASQTMANDLDKNKPTSNSQESAQGDSKKSSGDGAKAAMLLGMGLLAAGGLMLIGGKMLTATGTANKTQGEVLQGDLTGLMVAEGDLLVAQGTTEIGEGETLSTVGMFTMAGGGAAMVAGMMMKQNADKSAGYQGGLDSFGGMSPTGALGTAGSSSSGNKDGEKFKTADGAKEKPQVTANDLKDGVLGNIFGQLEEKTGMTRDGFIAAVSSGATPGEIFSKAAGMPAAEIDAALAKAANSGDFGKDGAIGSDVLQAAKDRGLGALADEVAAKTSAGAFAGSDQGSDYGGGAGASRAPAAAATSPMGLDMSAMDAKPASVGSSEKIDFSLLSDDVKRALAREGRTDKTIFQLVNSQYQKYTPMLFGADDMVATDQVDPLKNGGRAPAQADNDPD